MSQHQLTPNPFVPMLQIMHDVAIARCRVVKWKMTETQAWDVANYTRNPWNGQRSAIDMFKELKSGNGYLLGAKVEVKG